MVVDGEPPGQVVTLIQCTPRRSAHVSFCHGDFAVDQFLREAGSIRRITKPVLKSIYGTAQRRLELLIARKMEEPLTPALGLPSRTG